MANKSFFLRGCKAVDKNKKTYQEKAQETKQHSARLAEMQKYVDMSEEKRNLLLDIILNGKCPDDENESILHRGVLVYCSFLDVIDVISEDFKKAGINHYVITGETDIKKRGAVSKEFKKNPENTVVVISPACSESLNLNGTNILVMYSVGGSGISSPGKYSQLLGRICRGFSERFNSEKDSKFYILQCIVEDTCDEYAGILLSSRKELEEDILHADTIPLKENIGSYNSKILKEIRKKMLWKEKERLKFERQNKDR